MSANRKRIRLLSPCRQKEFVTAEAYLRSLDIAAQADEGEGIRQGVEDFKKGRVRPARKALAEFRRAHPPREKSR